MNMIINVGVAPGSSREAIESFGNNMFLTRVLSKETKEINAELIRMLSKHLGTPKNRILIKTGWEGNDKVLEIQ